MAIVAVHNEALTALRERAERAEALAQDVQALRERDNASALEHHAAQQQRLDQALMRIGALTAHLQDLFVWTGVLLGTAPDSEPDPSARDLVLASRRAAKQRLDADDTRAELLAELNTLRAAADHAIEKIKQHHAGQYDGQPLRSALAVLREARGGDKETT